MSDICIHDNPVSNPALEARAQMFSTDFKNVYDGDSYFASANVKSKLVAEKFIEETLKLPVPEQHEVFARAQQLNDNEQCLRSFNGTHLPVLNIVFDQQGKLAEFRELTMQNFNGPVIHALDLDLFHK